MIVRLQAKGFRNLVDSDHRLAPGVHFLFGDTGQGKTSLLEVIYAVVTSRSFRSPRLEHCVSKRLGPNVSRRAEEASVGDGFWISAETETEGVRTTLELSWQRQEGVQRKVNAGPAAVDEYLAVQSVVVWSSQDLETLVGPPALRRRLLDRGVVAQHPGALRALTTYRKVLEHKRSLLAQPRVDQEQLRSINVLFATAGEELMRHRREYALKLEHMLAGANRDLALPWSELRLRYQAADRPWQSDRAEPAAVEQSSSTARDQFLHELEKIVDQEIERRRPQLGPHLDRVEFEWQGVPVHHIASAGERKTLGLLLTLAQVRVLEQANRPPILLLDDLDTELDEDLIGRLVPLLSAAQQTFVTSNRRAVFAGLIDRLASSSQGFPSGQEEGLEEALPDAKNRVPGYFSWILENGCARPI